MPVALQLLLLLSPDAGRVNSPWPSKIASPAAADVEESLKLLALSLRSPPLVLACCLMAPKLSNGWLAILLRGVVARGFVVGLATGLVCSLVLLGLVPTPTLLRTPELLPLFSALWPRAWLLAVGLVPTPTVFTTTAAAAAAEVGGGLALSSLSRTPSSRYGAGSASPAATTGNAVVGEHRIEGGGERLRGGVVVERARRPLRRCD